MQQAASTAGIQPIKVKRWPSEIPLRIVIIIVSVLLWVGIIFGTMGIGLVYAILIGLFLFFIHVGLIMHLRGSAIQLGPDQFPEIHNRVVELAAKAGLKKTPDAYILQADGGLNAFATKFFRGRIITLYSDLLEACGDDTAARDMIIGHELGHLRSGHLDWQLLTAPGRFIPFLGSAYSRACEYTCDRWGAALSGDMEGARRGLLILAAGPAHSKRVNVSAYIAQQEKLNTGWMTLGRWLALYPPLSARVDVLSTDIGHRPFSSWKGPLRALAILASFVVVPAAIGIALPFLVQPLLRDLGIISSDLGTLVEPQNQNPNSDPALNPSTYGSVDEMPPATPAPTFSDTRLNELSQQCGAGDMQACDDLYNESDYGSPEEDYGNTCGGRLPDNALECTALVPQ